jgi:hypothetical protein
LNAEEEIMVGLRAVGMHIILHTMHILLIVEK